ncbi:unnamed protein product [Rhodiola kirilowii]
MGSEGSAGQLLVQFVDLNALLQQRSLQDIQHNWSDGTF